LPPPPEHSTAPPTAQATSKERPVERKLASATVDEVTADLKRDWRSEKDD
jgi:hypothetical protein